MLCVFVTLAVDRCRPAVVIPTTVIITIILYYYDAGPKCMVTSFCDRLLHTSANSVNRRVVLDSLTPTTPSDTLLLPPQPRH